MVPTAIPLKPWLTSNKVNKINGERVAKGVIGLAEHAGGVETAVEGNVEQNGVVWVPRAARVIL